MTKEIKHDYEVPEGWRVVAVRSPKNGEWFINNNGEAALVYCQRGMPRVIIEKTQPEPEGTLRFKLNWEMFGYAVFDYHQNDKTDMKDWISQIRLHWNGFKLDGTRYAFSHYEKDGEFFSINLPSNSLEEEPLQRADTIVFKRFEV